LRGGGGVRHGSPRTAATIVPVERKWPEGAAAKAAGEDAWLSWNNSSAGRIVDELLRRPVVVVELLRWPVVKVKLPWRERAAGSSRHGGKRGRRKMVGSRGWGRPAKTWELAVGWKRTGRRRPTLVRERDVVGDTCEPRDSD
jgi:hypothetical protein